jgi:hypothetical protein
MGWNEMIQRREARTRTPEFIAAMAREKIEFMQILSKLGLNTKNIGNRLIIKEPLKLWEGDLKALASGKKNKVSPAEGVGHAVFGKRGLVFDTAVIVARMFHLSGKAAKITIRKIFAI